MEEVSDWLAMADGPRYRTLKETEEYTAQLRSFMEKYSPDTVEAALLGVYWGLSRNPERYQQATWNIRQAKSRSLGTVPAFRLLFQIQDDDLILLLWIEEVGSTEEMMQE